MFSSDFPSQIFLVALSPSRPFLELCFVPSFTSMFANTLSIDEPLSSFATAASAFQYPMQTASVSEEDEESIKNAVGLAALRLAALNDR
jgi:hypothetical protein